MKILFTMIDICNPGGIVPFMEQYIKGLKDQGHEVGFVKLGMGGNTKPKKGLHVRKNIPKYDLERWNIGVGTGWYADAEAGWPQLPMIDVVDDLHFYQKYCSDYDVVIHNIPVLSKRKDNVGRSEWQNMYETGKDNFIIVHDGNLRKMCPHVMSVVDKISGAICVHDAAYNSAEWLPVPRVLIVNPQPIKDKLDVDNIKPISERDMSFFKLSTWKPWKRGAQLVEASIHIPKDIRKVFAGKGMGWYYLTSPDKCKHFLPNGDRVWETAIDNGLEYLGIINEDRRDEISKDVRLMIDPSWSKSYSEMGAHFNRTIVEGAMFGAVPVCTDLGMINGTIFVANENYIEIPHDATPEEYGQAIKNALDDTELLDRIQANNIKLLMTFDRNVIANKLVDFVSNPESGDVGDAPVEWIEKCNKLLDHFDIDPLHVDKPEDEPVRNLFNL